MNRRRSEQRNGVTTQRLTALREPHAGEFDHDGKRIFWKIDYYDPNLEFGS